MMLVTSTDFLPLSHKCIRTKNNLHNYFKSCVMLIKLNFFSITPLFNLDYTKKTSQKKKGDKVNLLPYSQSNVCSVLSMLVSPDRWRYGFLQIFLVGYGESSAWCCLHIYITAICGSEMWHSVFSLVIQKYTNSMLFIKNIAYFLNTPHL